ncbi:nucleotide disphospho-sugar-binding domain-containing protein [Streptomyces sp. NPDC050560]|uniref:nucleotide disphospho-sugar-binding domain-containing protein n=1 Tax=Streptomyces sp. NPDC050560 TaxID=3365630 RepID=UPI0037A276B3
MTEESPAPHYSIVILNAPAEPQTRSMLPIAQELQRRGHRITYVTTRDFAGRAVATGVDVLVHESCPTYGLDVESWECSGTADPGSVADTLDCAEEIHAEFVDDIPDLVLYEASARVTARLLTCRWNRPAVQILPSFARGDLVDGDEPPPLVPDADSDACVRELPTHVRERLFRFLSPAEKAGMSPSNFYTKPEPLSIALLPREFQADGELFDGHVAFVGPCIPERRMDERWLPPSTGLPVVFLSLDRALLDGAPDFVRDSVTALAGKPLHLVIAADSDTESLFPAGGQPPNVEIHAHVPRAVVLRCAAAHVCHSDLGGVMESLYFNTPLAAVPTSPRQRAVADRVAELGLGVRIVPADTEPAALADTVAALVDDPDISRSVRDFQRQARRAGGARRAADEIERYLEWSYEP